MEQWKLSDLDTSRLEWVHPVLREIVLAAANEAEPFRVLDSLRGEEAQQAAYARGNSKAKFGSSPHNWIPAVAVDLAPLPINWDNLEPFRALARHMKRAAASRGVALSWGGDWRSLKDYPHYELHPWRDWTHDAKLYRMPLVTYRAKGNTP